MLKLLFGIFGFFGCVYLALCAGLWLGQRRLMFLPTATVETTPASVGLTYEEVWIPLSTDAQSWLHGWWLPADHPTGLTFLYLHGNAGNMSNTLERAAQLKALGAAVLTLDYRGYGLSSGPFPSEKQLYEDVLAAYQFLQVEKEVAPQHLVVYGHSLGGALAIDLAARLPQLAGLIVEGSFTSMADMATQSHYNRWFPVRLLLTQWFDSRAKVPDLKLPVLYIHGLADTSVPVTMSQALYDATTAPKELWLVPDADHNNLIEHNGPEFEQRIRAFLSDYVLVNR